MITYTDITISQIDDYEKILEKLPVQIQNILVHIMNFM